MPVEVHFTPCARCGHDAYATDLDGTPLCFDHYVDQVTDRVLNGGSES